MAKIKAFHGLRPKADLVSKVAELPYDVVNSEEAREIAMGNKFSFYHISKPEIDLPSDIDPYSNSVYAMGRHNLDDFIKQGILQKEKKPSLYLYTLIMDGRSQTGLVACVNIDDYNNNVIKKHELTREDKEIDRTRHLDSLNANTGPVFLLFKDDPVKKQSFDIALENKPVYDFTSVDGIRHIVRIIDDTILIDQLISSFKDDILYIADGHHRAASAVRVGMNRRKDNPDFTGEEEYNWFLAVIFPGSQLKIMPYNRAVKDLAGQTPSSFIEKVSQKFNVNKNGIKSPQQSHKISMYLSGEWYTIEPKFPIENDPIDSLDVSILQNTILSVILNIQDPRTDKRIDFIGGIRGTNELERLVDSGKYQVAFSMFPTTIDQLIRVSDSGSIMPPKSTWFEPKLRSGLLLHLLT